MSRTCLYNGYRVSISWFNKWVGPNALIDKELIKSIRQSNTKLRRKNTMRRLKAKAVKVIPHTPPKPDEEKSSANLLLDTVVKGCARKGDSLEDFVGGNYKLLLRCKA